VINLDCHDKPPHALGDTIDFALLAHMISKVENDVVNITCKHTKVHWYNEYLKKIKFFVKIIDLGNVTIDQEGNPSRMFAHTTLGKLNAPKQYIPYSKQIKDITTKNEIPQFKIELPDNFVTTQWDAKQNYRVLDPKRIKNIESYYKAQGYDIVNIGNRKYEYPQCLYILSKAKHHVGADSGIAHLAKLVMPADKIHLYLNIERHDSVRRFPDRMGVAFQARELMRRGAKMNYCENPDKDSIEYYKNVDIYMR